MDWSPCEIEEIALKERARERKRRRKAVREGGGRRGEEVVEPVETERKRMERKGEG